MNTPLVSAILDSPAAVSLSCAAVASCAAEAKISDIARRLQAVPGIGSVMLAAIALANKMARMVWAMLAQNDIYRVPHGAVC